MRAGARARRRVQLQAQVTGATAVRGRFAPRPRSRGPRAGGSEQTATGVKQAPAWTAQRARHRAGQRHARGRYPRERYAMVGGRDESRSAPAALDRSRGRVVRRGLRLRGGRLARSASGGAGRAGALAGAAHLAGGRARVVRSRPAASGRRATVPGQRPGPVRAVGDVAGGGGEAAPHRASHRAARRGAGALPARRVPRGHREAGGRGGARSRGERAHLQPGRHPRAARRDRAGRALLPSLSRDGGAPEGARGGRGGPQAAAGGEARALQREAAAARARARALRRGLRGAAVPAAPAASLRGGGQRAAAWALALRQRGHRRGVARGRRRVRGAGGGAGSRSSRRTGGGVSVADLQADASAAHRCAVAADVALLVAGLSGAAALYLYLSPRAPAASPRAARPVSAALSGTAIPGRDGGAPSLGASAAEDEPRVGLSLVAGGARLQVQF